MPNSDLSSCPISVKSLCTPRKKLLFVSFIVKGLRDKEPCPEPNRPQIAVLGFEVVMSEFIVHVQEPCRNILLGAYI